jgi:hypothetical protein
MSFAGPAGKKGLGVLRGRGRGRGWSAEGDDPSASQAQAPRDEAAAGAGRHASSRAEGQGYVGSPDGGADLERVGWLGAGIAIGAVLGAGIALLYAPQSGLQTRAAIRRRGHTMAARGRDAWDELAEELRKTARRRMKKMRRKATRAQWAAEDWREERGW